MTHYRDSNLERRLANLESDHVERKDSVGGDATSRAERVLDERLRHRDRPFDVQRLPSATLADLDLLRFESEYMVAAVALDVLAANERTQTQRLAATKMVWAADEPIPTVLGVLVLSPRAREFLPGAYIQFLRIAGTELSDSITDEQVIEGVVADVLRHIDDRLAAHNRVKVDFVSGAVEYHRGHVRGGSPTATALVHGRGMDPAVTPA